MDRMYNLNELAMMTGFSTRTLRSYLNSGLLEGEKQNGAWQFSTAQLSRFFEEPFVREGLRIKQKGIVFDFLATHNKPAEAACIMLDLPISPERASEVSEFFCEQCKSAQNICFSYHFDHGVARVILSGEAKTVAAIITAFYTSMNQK